MGVLLLNKMKVLRRYVDALGLLFMRSLGCSEGHNVLEQNKKPFPNHDAISGAILEVCNQWRYC
jgi:hypothetical protein